MTKIPQRQARINKKKFEKKTYITSSAENKAKPEKCSPTLEVYCGASMSLSVPWIESSPTRVPEKNYRQI